MDFEVGDWEGKPRARTSAVRPMQEARNFLFCVRPEAKSPQHADELVAKMPVAAGPSARVATARMCVIALRIVPTPPSPGAGGPTATAAAATGVKGDMNPKKHTIETQ